MTDRSEPTTAAGRVRERLRGLDDRSHDSWPRWTYRDYVDVSQALAEAEPDAPSERSEPVTEAGRQLLGDFIDEEGDYLSPWQVRGMILAIEAEAAAPHIKERDALSVLLDYEQALPPSDPPALAQPAEGADAVER